ncbi:protein-arginine deiminase type-2 [Salarias fasciatus]|uniref:Protein-arginine deiminase n=1 Tax=Salarias fasciatus TaxID=181472 RepID=A0A672GAU2_SALFA|nr:protein-arginine deiminase type-2-like [Salarias fasciatus]
MAHLRTLRADYNRTTSVLYVVGSEITVNLNRSAPPCSKFFSVKHTADVQYSINPPRSEADHLSPIPLNDDTVLLFSMKKASEEENDNKLSVRYYGTDKKMLGTAVLHLTAVEISLDVDADRDGIVEKNNPNKGCWKWGPDGHGAIILVNCDSERRWRKLDHEQDFIDRESDLKDMTTMVLRTKGPAKLPEGYKLTMHISQGDAESIRVYTSADGAVGRKWHRYPLILQSACLSAEVLYRRGFAENKFYVEGIRFPDKDFDGLVTINLSLLEPIGPGIPETPIFTDKVVLRIAPWIMTPNTLTPKEVFVCSTTDNYTFLKEIRSFVAKSGHNLKICHEYMNRGDRWMQDEVEFGYIDSPHQRFPVVLDSPRDRGLVDFPYEKLLGPDFGYVTKKAQKEDVNSLDSFGNLEVSPPVTVNGKKYPLGRIIIGVAFPTAAQGRNMTQVIQDFLWAQKVQEPIALFSDWLCIGHVDEFMTFVPAPDKNGFRLLLASPDAGYKLFKSLSKQGHGNATLFDGVETETPRPVDDILNDEELQDHNNYVQSCIDWNRDVLKRELGLDEGDIIDLPILFKLVKEDEEVRALAYYPDVVNMLVLGKNLGIPKPFGPKVNGRCAIEAEVCSLLEPLGLSCTFIDNFASYHQLLGEVHCGSNVRREPFDFKWWNMEM